MVEGQSRSKQIWETVGGENVFERVDFIIDEAMNWKLPKAESNKTIRRAFRKHKYPTYLTEELRKSNEFAIPEFKPNDEHFTAELFCELFAGTLLMPCIVLEEYIVDGVSIADMAAQFEVPEDNAAIRLATYYLLRFSPEPAVRNYLRGVERIGFALYTASIEQMDPELGAELTNLL